jgi:hypothetical protein
MYLPGLVFRDQPENLGRHWQQRPGQREHLLMKISTGSGAEVTSAAVTSDSTGDSRLARKSRIRPDYGANSDRSSHRGRCHVDPKVFHELGS